MSIGYSQNYPRVIFKQLIKTVMSRRPVLLLNFACHARLYACPLRSYVGVLLFALQVSDSRAGEYRASHASTGETLFSAAMKSKDMSCSLCASHDWFFCHFPETFSFNIFCRTRS